MRANKVTVERIDNGLLVSAEYPLDADQDDTQHFYKDELKALGAVARILGIPTGGDDDGE